MERVGFQRFARVFSRNMLERARACDVDRQGHQQHQDRGDARLDMHAAKEEPVKCFINDVERGEEQQAGLDERGEVFEFAVTVGMAFIRRLVRRRARRET